MWTPSAANASDANGTAVQPLLETGFYKLGQTGRKRLGGVWTGYELFTSGSAAQLQVSFALSPELQSYQPVATALPQNTQWLRRRVPIRRKTLGVALKFQQVGASADTKLGEVEADGYALEETR
jgi:hypothetical protein